MEKVVVGFSGGLDTTYCVKYLTLEKGLEVHSVIVNTGGFSEEELKKVEAHAYALGVKTHTTVNAVKGYYDSIIKYLIYVIMVMGLHHLRCMLYLFIYATFITKNSSMSRNGRINNPNLNLPSLK